MWIISIEKISKKISSRTSNWNLLSTFNNAVVLRSYPKIFNPFQKQKMTIPRFQLKQIISSTSKTHLILSEPEFKQQLSILSGLKYSKLSLSADSAGSQSCFNMTFLAWSNSKLPSYLRLLNCINVILHKFKIYLCVCLPLTHI